MNKPEDHAIIGCATGCLEVSSFMYPYTAWKDSFIHNAFENTGATMSGVEAACRKSFPWISNNLEKILRKLWLHIHAQNQTTY